MHWEERKTLRAKYGLEDNRMLLVRLMWNRTSK